MKDVEPRRPIRAESKKTEISAVQIVEKMLNGLNWSCQRLDPREDLGLDHFITVCDSNPRRTPTGTDFVAQVRGTIRPRFTDGFVLHSIDQKHILYWRERPLPVLYLLVDVPAETVYWLWVKHHLRSPQLEAKRRRQRRVLLKIPLGNLLTAGNAGSLARQAARMVWPLVHETLRVPSELSLAEARKCFPFKLRHLPYPFLDEHDDRVDCLIITGPSRYDLEKMERRFTKLGGGFIDKVLGAEIVLGESSYNLGLAGEIAAALTYGAARTKGGGAILSSVHLLPYVCVTEAELGKHNLILLPCGDVNPILTQALIDFEMTHLVRCPVHHEPYHSSERIRWETSGRVFEKQREDEAAGYILLLPNPWNPEKAALICGGNRGVGTQAALLRLLQAFRGSRRLIDRDGLPACVVTARFSKDTLRVNAAIEIR
jgi:hypothetical protein